MSFSSTWLGKKDELTTVAKSVRDDERLRMAIQLEIPKSCFRPARHGAVKLTAGSVKCLSEEFLNHMNHM